jgi:uncharacterized protein (TIGR03067 family)
MHMQFVQQFLQGQPDLHTYLIVGGIAVIVLAFICYLLPLRRLKIPAILASTLGALALGVGLGVTAVFMMGYHWERQPLQLGAGEGGGAAKGGGKGGGKGKNVGADFMAKMKNFKGGKGKAAEGGKAGPAANGKTKPRPDSPEQEKLQGTWQVTAIDAAGKPVSAAGIQKIGLQYIFAGNKVTVRRVRRDDETNTFTVEGNTSPRKLTINSTPVIHALYALDGNKLQLCVLADDNPNAGYPTELASKASPKTDLLTLERK